MASNPASRSLPIVVVGAGPPCATRRAREETLSLRAGAGRFWVRHRSLFWMLHSAWALASGVAVLLLARERYHFVPWVMLFLGLTWVSTFMFGRAGTREQGGNPRLVWEVASYLTRVLYQETLFFLLPFYAYSMVLRSPNVLFVGLLAGLAVLSCIDLLFDRWLRTRPLFALTFFAIVAFATLNLLLPLAARVPPSVAAPAAALLAVGSAAVLALRVGGAGRRPHLLLAAVGVLLLGAVLGLPQLIPPVPLRLERARFAAGIDRGTLALRNPLRAHATSALVGHELVVLFDVFAPTAVPATVQVEWSRDGALLRLSRNVAITAHAGGFRVWDGWHPASGAVSPGRYRVVLETTGKRVFGVARITIEE